MEPEGSSPYTQEPATCPYPEPDPVCATTPNLSKIHFNIILKSTPVFLVKPLLIHCTIDWKTGAPFTRGTRHF
jgi:hypothetical protein